MPVAKVDFSDLGRLDIELAKLPSRAEARIFSLGYSAASRVARNQFRKKDFMFFDRSGALRRSAKTVKRKGAALLRVGGAGARHAHLIEYGTRRGVKARAPLRVAAYSTEREQLDAAIARMRRELDKLKF